MKVKKIALWICASLAVFSAVALADILLPNQTVVGMDDATRLYDKIEEVTGQTPVQASMPGHNGDYVTANATIRCKKGGACVVTITK